MSNGFRYKDTRFPGPTACGVSTLGGEASLSWSGVDRLTVRDLSPHNYSKTWTEFSNAPVDNRVPALDVNGTWVLGTVTTCCGGPFHGAALEWGSNDDINLLNKLGSKIRGHDLALGTALATSKDSIELVTNTAVGLYRAAKHIKHGNFAKAANVLGVDFRRSINFNVRNTFASNWLSFSYGWKPLLGDIHEAMTAIDVASRPRPLKFRARSTLQSETITTVGAIAMTSQKLYRKQIIVTLLESPPLPVTLQLDDPLTIAWELLPFSFVADWFLPIGDFLNARQIVSNLKVVDVVTTTKSTREITNVSSTVPYLTYNGGYVHKYGIIDRVVTHVMPEVPLPSFTPIHDVFSSLPRCLNALSLLQVMFRK